MHTHSAHLMAQFMSPIINHQIDKYGGGLDSRLRFALESIQAIKTSVGNDFPLLFRYAVDAFADGGRGLDESQVVAQSANHSHGTPNPQGDQENYRQY